MHMDPETRNYFMKIEINKELDDILKEIMQVVKAGFLNIIDNQKRLHISNIPFSYREPDLMKLFEPFGTVFEAEIIYNDRGSKGFGFLTMNLEGANKACEALHGSWIRGRVIEVNDATPKKKHTFTKRKITMCSSRSNSITSCITPPGFDTAPTRYVPRKLFHD
ncbi:hypothetical protein PVAND_001292 [Polypedilum vanderplanki]|uniref:RRM domain-containing protein n=1 Tax=Polypedilum vanderplanki TaxID=319348 RepID=A0A9J6BNT9_POLVA|nr:hypothetical protein PVAND_001292 [Polypedilum vanderplanki]